MNRIIAVFALGVCLSGQTLKKIGIIDLPGPKGQRFDYLTMDDEDRYLLSAHLGPGILYVIDVRTNALVRAIPNVPGITGLEYVPGLHKVYTSDWGEEKIGVVDLRSMKVIKRLPTAEKPNGSTYAAPFRKVYVSDTNGKAVAVVDVDKDQIVKTLDFNSETGMPVYDTVAKRVYVEPAQYERGRGDRSGNQHRCRQVRRSRMRAQPWHGRGLGAPSRISALRRKQDAHRLCIGRPQGHRSLPDTSGCRCRQI